VIGAELKVMPAPDTRENRALPAEKVIDITPALAVARVSGILESLRSAPPGWDFIPSRTAPPGYRVRACLRDTE